MPQTPEWLEDALQTAQFHRFHKLSNEKRWTLKDTAKKLRRSIGSICEDLLIAKESKIYDLTQFEFAFEALNYIRMKKKERELEE